MKNKVLIISLIIVVILLFYNMICYKIVKNNIDKETREIISGYIKNNDYEFINAYNGDNNTIRIFIKNDNSYFQFIMDKNNYQVKEINNYIPAYVR